MADAVAAGKEQSSRADADAYVARMRGVICSDLRNGAKPPPVAPGGPTTTIPEACADLDSRPGPTTTTEPGESSPSTTTAGATGPADTTAP